MRVGLGRLLQSVGNGLSHSADGNVLKGGAGGSDGRAGNQLLDVLLGDLATLAGTLDAIKADTLGSGKTDSSGESVGLTVESALDSALGRVLLRGRRLRGRGGGRLRGRRRLLLGLSGLGSAASVLDRELLESGDVGSLFDQDSNGLYRSNKKKSMISIGKRWQG